MTNSKRGRGRQKHQYHESTEEELVQYDQESQRLLKELAPQQVAWYEDDSPLKIRVETQSLM